MMSISGPAPTEAVTPDPPPLAGRRVLRQRWTDLAYFHWPYEPADVQRLLPEGVSVDTFDGAAWVGVIPFVMCDVRVGPTPPVPWLGTFIEINVRTYVVDRRGRRAVWFFSLDVPRSAIVAVARTAFALPYCWAHATHRVDGRRHRYTMQRRWPDRGPSADLAFTVADHIEPSEVGELDHFLSARWGLLTTRRGRVLHGAVHHERWPLHYVSDVSIDQDIVEAAGLPTPDGAPRALCSPGVGVEVSWLRRVGDGTGAAR
ncbi:MAG: DUF2071 domain-containing protein [Ilumatobacter sp.]|uniref:YqjF family protein n=1 Tax=Ilumatobacter sp. TaxID=1967498 RepID=UPI0026309D27|nr:DUF2071 domain-containing protein [Ilumatobacter sp.]MDJ0768905.1 DUF2071 domain-containing protein [Ilumatobacter sp.]